GCDVIQLKTYGKHTGVVQVGAIGDPEGETLLLAQVNHLKRTARAEANRLALELDTRGPSINEIYATTAPAVLAKHGHRHDGHDGDDDDDGDEHGDGDDDRAGLAAPDALVGMRTFMTVSPNPARSTTGIAYGISKDGP